MAVGGCCGPITQLGFISEAVASVPFRERRAEVLQPDLLVLLRAVDLQHLSVMPVAAFIPLDQRAAVLLATTVDHRVQVVRPVVKGRTLIAVRDLAETRKDSADPLSTRSGGTCRTVIQLTV